jgi:hypothetical protein
VLQICLISSPVSTIVGDEGRCYARPSPEPERSGIAAWIAQLS